MAIARNARVEPGAVLVHATAGDFIVHEITVTGTTAPVFSVVDSQADRVLMTHAAINGSAAKRQWPLPADLVRVSTQHAVGFTFLGPIQYNWKATFHSVSGQRVVADVDYKASQPEQAAFDSLAINTF